jgi:AcrR family transcriptional regulator
MVSKRSAKTVKNTCREDILRAAGELFFEKGYGGTSMSMIAARVGGSKGTLYNYFTSKKELFAAQVQVTCNSSVGRIFDCGAAHEADPTIALLRIQTQQFSRSALRSHRRSMHLWRSTDRSRTPRAAGGPTQFATLATDRITSAELGRLLAAASLAMGLVF